MKELDRIQSHLTEGLSPGEPAAVDSIHDSRLFEFIQVATGETPLASGAPGSPAAPDAPECLLPGSLLAACQGEAPAALALLKPTEEYQLHLARRWGVQEAAEARKALEWICFGGTPSQEENSFCQLRDGAFALFEPPQIDNFEQCFLQLVEWFGFSPLLVESCTTVAAWRAERLAWLARVLLHVGYLGQGEAYGWLHYANTLVRQHFDGWDQYLISACFGSTVTDEDSSKVLQAAHRLWEEAPLPWGEYPTALL